MKRDLYGIEMAGFFAMAVVWYSHYAMTWYLGKRLVNRAEGSAVTFAASIFLMIFGSGSLIFPAQINTLRICLSNRDLIPQKQNVYIANYVFLNQHQYPLPGSVPACGTGKIGDIHKGLDKVYKE